MSKPQLIAIDWGSSNFRAYLLNHNGVIIDQIFTHCGILNVRNNDFSKTLLKVCQIWLDNYPDLPIVMCGMIGSRQGWHEVPYVACPADISAVAKNLYHFNALNRSIYIVPGLDIHSSEQYNVMRGEETQIFGLLHHSDESKTSYICLPGTHSKWAVIENKKIINFYTFMSGELFKILSQYSILSKLMADGDFDESAYRKGLHKSHSGHSFLVDLFTVRTYGLANKLTNKQIKYYLAGLLIGYEVKEAISLLNVDMVTIIANTNLSKNYVRALQEYKIICHAPKSEKITAIGLHQIAKTAGII